MHVNGFHTMIERTQSANWCQPSPSNRIGSKKKAPKPVTLRNGFTINGSGAPGAFYLGLDIPFNEGESTVFRADEHPPSQPTADPSPPMGGGRLAPVRSCVASIVVWKPLTCNPHQSLHIPSALAHAPARD